MELFLYAGGRSISWGSSMPKVCRWKSNRESAEAERRQPAAARKRNWTAPVSPPGKAGAGGFPPRREHAARQPKRRHASMHPAPPTRGLPPPCGSPASARTTISPEIRPPFLRSPPKTVDDVNNFRHHEIPASLRSDSYSHPVGTAHSHRRNPQRVQYKRADRGENASRCPRVSGGHSCAMAVLPGALPSLSPKD